MTGRVRLLFAIAFLNVAAYVSIRLALGGSEGLYMVTAVAVTFYAALGCGAAAVQFDRGDFLRLAWYLQGVGFLALTLSAIWRGFAPQELVPYGRAAMTLVSNTAQVAGSILFARMYRVAGIDLPGTKVSRGGVQMMAVAFAVAAAGLPIVNGFQELFGMRKVGAFVAIFSATGDAISLILMAPILMTALALRGGLFAWPWIFWTLALMSWLLYDAQDAVAFFLVEKGTSNPDWLRAGSEPFRILACSFCAAAGFTQRWISRGAIRHASDAP